MGSEGGVGGFGHFDRVGVGGLPSGELSIQGPFDQVTGIPSGPELLDSETGSRKLQTESEGGVGGFGHFDRVPVGGLPSGELSIQGPVDQVTGIPSGPDFLDSEPGSRKLQTVLEAGVGGLPSGELSIQGPFDQVTGIPSGPELLDSEPGSHKLQTESEG